MIIFAAPWAGPLVVAVAFFLVGLGAILAIRAYFILFTKRDEVVGLHLASQNEGEDE